MHTLKCTLLLLYVKYEYTSRIIHAKSVTLHLNLLSNSLRCLRLGNLGVSGAAQPALLQHILNEGLSSLVTRAHERPRSAVQEAQVESSLAPEFELVGSDVFVDSHVALGGAHVLAKGYDIDVVLAEFWSKVSGER
jgi:hypothetical protein